MTIENAVRNSPRRQQTENSQHLFPEIRVMKTEPELKKCIEYLFPEVSPGNDETVPERGARSAPGSRSCSFKEKQNELCVPRERQRRNSMPQTSDNLLSVSKCSPRRERHPLRRVRSFKTTSKGIVNRGDSFRRKAEDNIATRGRVQSENDSDVTVETRQRISSDTSNDTVCTTGSLAGYYKVAILGAHGVGKTAMMNQFMTSDYIGAFDISNENLLERVDDEEMKVSVLLDGEESMMEFIEIDDPKTDLEALQMDAYLVLYSVNDRDTYNTAVTYIHKLRTEIGSDRVLIIVGNKVDLVRKRFVSEEEAKITADQYGCKYAEISAGLNHKVDELLVGILRQIRLNLNPVVIDSEKDLDREKESCSKGPMKILSKLFRRNMKKVKACEKLYEP